MFDRHPVRHSVGRGPGGIGMLDFTCDRRSATLPVTGVLQG